MCIRDRIVGRSKGNSVISASAYLNGDVMKNEETGRISYYTSKKEVVYTLSLIHILLHSHDDKTFIISPRLFAAIYNDDLLERVRDITPVSYTHLHCPPYTAIRCYSYP